MIYHERISLGAQAYQAIRQMIVGLELAPGDVVREDDLQRQLGIGRTPIREALQRLAREQFVTVLPRRGMLVSGIDVTELGLLYETRAMLEPFAARLACGRGREQHWAAMADALDHASGATTIELLDLDRVCHELTWEAAGNRYLTDTLDTLYAQSDRLWHLYLSDTVNGVDMAHAVEEHAEILDAFRRGDADRAATLAEAHVRSFDAQIRTAVRTHLEAPLAGR
ncbi:MAG: GntR family transcriptional regulator [Ilumatobacteraceae bacterium]